jgi:hypothetical protein
MIYFLKIKGYMLGLHLSFWLVLLLDKGGSSHFVLCTYCFFFRKRGWVSASINIDYIRQCKAKPANKSF